MKVLGVPLVYLGYAFLGAISSLTTWLYILPHLPNYHGTCP